MKVSDYIANFIAEHGITEVFTVVGGGAMHLNDSFGHHKGLHCTYNHHEQASAMAAEAYARVNGRMAAVCVTSGPGGINALNGVAGAYVDSIPMLVFSGQMKREMTVRYTKVPVRSLGSQEFDIVSSIGRMTKFAEMVDDPQKIRCFLEKAYVTAISGRPGPCWLDIPLDIQGMSIEASQLEGYTYKSDFYKSNLNGTVFNDIISHLRRAKRPIFYAGNGIRLAKAMDFFRDFISKTEIPVVTCWDSIDLISNDHPCYCGRGGIMGDRAGNFAVQNSDFLLCVGTRLNILQVGYNTNTWAREAYKVMVDIDEAELFKPTIHVDVPVCADAADFLKKICEELPSDISLPKSWKVQCQDWKSAYPVVSQEKYSQTGEANVYAFIDCLSRRLSEDSLIVVGNGSASVVGSQTFYIKKDSRFIMNCAMSSMGYDLPAAVGACIGAKRKETICITGDGSIMMNLQELQTIITNRLPIKIFIINNLGYHQIRQTQTNMFDSTLIGVGPDSGDLGFPDFSKLADAFGYPYIRIENNGEMKQKIDEILSLEGYAICEVYVSVTQKFEPKSATKRLEDGKLFSPPLEDMAPFLPREELKSNMYIPLISEE